jgi:positive regulator of sigma E activity
VYCIYIGILWLVYYIVRVWLVYILWLFYIVRVYSIFQAEFFGDIFVFLLQILVEFFIITSKISRQDEWTAFDKPFIVNSSETFVDARALT